VIFLGNFLRISRKFPSFLGGKCTKNGLLVTTRMKKMKRTERLKKPIILGLLHVTPVR
jgi:hypothetical protein